MSEQYYYLLDGQEHGPFSRIAINKLISSGQIGGSLFRSDPSEPWQTAGEIGLVPTPKARPSVDAKAVDSNHESLRSPMPRNTESRGMFGDRHDSRKTSSKTGLLLLCCVFVGLGIGAWYLFTREAHTSVPTQNAIPPRAQVIPDEAAPNAQEAVVAESTGQEEMTISGKYHFDGDDGYSMGFAPDEDSLRKYPTLVVNDGSFVVENAKQAFDQMSINPDSLDKNCFYGGIATVTIKNSRQETPNCDRACEEGDCGDSCDPYPVASLVSVKKAVPPEGSPYSYNNGKCKGGSALAESETKLGANADQNQLRFNGMEEVLELAALKGSADWTPESMRECECTIKGNVIELDASTRMVLFNDATGPSVVAYYWEDNHGNPYTHFYRYDGEWRDAGVDVMPGYTGKHDDYFEASKDGVKKWVKGKPAQMYAYRAGSFRLVE